MAALMLLPLLYACQSEEPVKTENPKHKITVKAYLPDSEGSRAQITYGNPDKEIGETFMWEEPREGVDSEEIFIYNTSNLDDNPTEASFILQKTNGKEAEFEFVPSISGHATSFTCKSGDTLLVTHGEGHIVYYKNTAGEVHYDERKIIILGLGTEENKPQYIENNPDNTTLSYMKDNLKMYAIVKVEEDDKVPEIHFRHLSAIMRVTLRNATGKDLYPTKLEFKYPGTESFFNTTLYCSVDNNSSNGSGLIVYDDDEFFKGSKVYTDTIGTTINGKTGTDDAGESIPDGKSYELYLSTVPRIGNDSYGDELTISLIISHDTNNPYRVTLNPFKNPDGTPVIITAGKRYWFDLTAVGDNKAGTQQLMLTSEWKKLHPDEKAPGE